MVRLHITGASGSGTTMLGRALSKRLHISHLDTDDFFWFPIEPLFSRARLPEDRIKLLNEAFAKAGSWVLSGSIGHWGASLEQQFDLVIFLSVPTALRLSRLKAREIQRFGAKRLAPGGDRHESYKAFLDWAAGYENGSPQQRSRVMHENQLGKLPCPVLRFEGDRPLEALVTESLAALRDHKLIP